MVKNPKFASYKGQLGGPYIGMAVFFLLGIVVLTNLYTGTVAQTWTNQTLVGTALNNTYATLTVQNPPYMHGYGMAVRNRSQSALTSCGTAPCYIANDSVPGRITINMTGLTATQLDAQTMYVDYVENKVHTTGYSTGVSVNTYLMTGIGIAAIAFIVMGGALLFRKLRELQ